MNSAKAQLFAIIYNNIAHMQQQQKWKAITQHMSRQNALTL